MIHLNGLTKHFPGSGPVLRDVTLRIAKGEVFGIIGRSGAGKSTLVRCINRLETPDSGHTLAALFGIPLGVLLLVTGRGHILERPGFNRIMGAVVNATRSTPFILRARQEAAPIQGDLAAVPERDVVYVSASSGSTGVPTISPFTQGDFDDWIDFEARLFWSSGLRPTDRYAHSRTPVAQFTAAGRVTVICAN